ncbi:MAG: hypothetical protein ACI9T8_000048 [Candidatus Saccharimonadales bacterium]|jgi:hypothetical protein
MPQFMYHLRSPEVQPESGEVGPETPVCIKSIEGFLPSATAPCELADTCTYEVATNRIVSVQMATGTCALAALGE